MVKNIKFLENFRTKTLNHFWKSTNNVSISHFPNIKIRLYNKFYFPPFSYSANQRTVIFFENDGTPNRIYYPIKTWNLDCFIYFNKEGVSYPIIGFYKIDRKIVLCSYPDLKTLRDSYINSGYETIMKLAALTGSDPLESETILERLMKYDIEL